MVYVEVVMDIVMGVVAVCVAVVVGGSLLPHDSRGK